MSKAIRGVLFLLACALIASPVRSDEYYDRYDLSPRASGFDLGVQPLGYPVALIGATMRRDRILRQQMEKHGHPFNTYAFRRGPDIVKFLGKGRLEGGIMGDMPTILAAAQDEISIVGIAKLSSSAVVSRHNGLMERLAGKRIGYVPASSAHHTLLQGLSSVGLSEKDVTLVEMRIDQMPEALEQGNIDAFASWEPAPSIAMARNSANRIVFRGPSTDYFVISRNFSRQNPEAAREVVAGFVRALQWMQRSRKNIEQATEWAIADGQALTGKLPEISLSQSVDITRREILDIPSAPSIPPTAGPEQTLPGVFRFLQEQGKIPKDSDWGRISSAFEYEGLREVMRDKKRYQLTTFDYGP